MTASTDDSLPAPRAPALGPQYAAHGRDRLKFVHAAGVADAMKPYPLIVTLLAVVFFPITAIFLFVAALRGRWERKHQQ